MSTLLIISLSDLTKDKTERFLNRISFVYSNIDSEFHHGNKIRKYNVFIWYFEMYTLIKLKCKFLE